MKIHVSRRIQIGQSSFRFELFKAAITIGRWRASHLAYNAKLRVKYTAFDEAFLFVLLRCTLLAIHLVFAHLAAAGPLAATWLQWRSRSTGQKRLACLARRIAIVSLASLVVAATLGGALLGLAWLDDGSTLLDTLSRLPTASLWNLGIEYLFSLVLLAVHLAIWPRETTGAFRRGIHHTLALLAATNLLYHFPVFFTAVASADQASGAAEISKEAFRVLRFRPHTWSLAIHHWLAACAVTGVSLQLLLGAKEGSNCRVDDSAIVDRIGRIGSRFALAATSLQVVSGMAVFFHLPAAQQQSLLGHDIVSTALFGGSVLFAVWLLHRLANSSLAGDTPRGAWLTAALMFLVILLMILTLQGVRQSSPAFMVKVPNTVEL